ncbi:MAG: DUF2269 family protein [Devosia sp.]|nr:DUF2269 family protein [Devosia sp.]
MDLYSIFKFLHVFSAVCWVGGGLCLTVLGALASSRKDEAEMLRVVENVAFMANRWFMPLSLLTLLFGLLTTWLGGLFSQLWVILGLVGFGMAFLTGSLVLGPTSEKIRKLKETGRETDAYPLGRRLLRAAKFDYVVMFAVIADMVIKPGIADLPVLGVLALVLVGGAVVFLGGIFKSEPAAA